MLDLLFDLYRVLAVVGGLFLAGGLVALVAGVGRVVRLSRPDVLAPVVASVRVRGRASMPGRSCRGVVLGGGL